MSEQQRRTYRERREAKAERLREWAEKREAKAAAVLAGGEPMRSDWAFITQPGHIPARARLIAREDRDYDSLAKAASMEARATGIKSQLAASIYSDDADVIERLTERIAGLEAERDRIKAFNTSCRKGEPDWSLLTEDEASNLHRTAQVAPYQVTDRAGKFKGFPGYHLTNLSGNIKRNRDRLTQIVHDRADSLVTDLIVCEVPTCTAEFHYVAEREFPGLCLDHAAEADRERHGWSPANSVD